MSSQLRRLAFLLCAALSLIACVFATLSVRAFLTTAQHVEGSVIGLRYGSHKPDISFRTLSGETLSFGENSALVDYKVGDRVGLFYDPASPADTVQVDSPSSVWSGPGVLAAMCIFFLANALVKPKPD